MTDNSFGEYHRRLSRESRREPLYPFKPVAPLPPNTLRNSDGTPYSAGYDGTNQEKLQEAIAILEQEIPSVSKTCCEHLEQARRLIQDVLETL